MKFFTGDSHKKYSIERLRCLYGDLLRCIDYENHHVRLESRHQEPQSSPRFGLGRKVFWLKTKDLENDVDTEQQRRELSSAFWALAATRSAVHKNHSMAVLARDEATVAALQTAKSLEQSVVSLIRSIGEVVVNAKGRKQQQQQATDDATKQDLRSDAAFEYFCEKAILALFVEISCETPYSSGEAVQSNFHGVVWSPHVKAQVFHTISLLVAGVRDYSALYYLLSQNCINQLVAGMLPLQQWTDPALEIMLPPYVEMLKTLALQLGDDAPHLFPFFIVQDEQQRIHFPLFSATLQTGTSSFAQSNSFVHATCLNLIVDVMEIPYPPIQDWLGQQAHAEQDAFANHLCALLLRRYTRLVHLTEGPVVDNIRSTAIAGQLKGLNDQMELLNDVFSCPLRGLKIRLCEQLLQQVVTVLCKSCGSAGHRHFLSSVGVSDMDVVPVSEASAQVAKVVLSCILTKLRYPPALRMLGVALWHAQASPLWASKKEDDKDVEDKITNGNDENYGYTKALHQVVKGDAPDLVSNEFRLQFFKALRGDHGEWRVVTAATLLHQCLRSMDSETLLLLELIPKSVETTPVEEAVATFLRREHTRNSIVSGTALECIASLAIEWVHCVVRNGEDRVMALKRIGQSPLLTALRTTRDFFFRSTTQGENIVGVSDLFVDIVESTVISNYRKITLNVNGVRTGPRILAYNLGQVGCARHVSDAEVLVRKIRSIKTNEVELTRFHAQHALYFRAVVRVVEAFLENSSKSKSNTEGPDMIDRADELKLIFGNLREKPQVGTDIDIRGRMSFPFLVDGPITDQKHDNAEVHYERDRTFSEDMIFRSASTLLVALDPTALFVVKPLKRDETSRGTVICCVPLLNVIAAATDGEWLHVAVRHDDVGFLIKNGNMALRFDTPGTGLIVRQYIDRSRQVLRGELVRKINALFAVPEPLIDASLKTADEATLVEDKKEEVPSEAL